MGIVTKICVFITLFGIDHTEDWKHKMYLQGENATVRIDHLQLNGKKLLEITFSGYTSKLHVTNVMMYDSKEKQADYNRVYTGRIEKINMDNSCLSFLLLNVSFVDSGTYIVFEDSHAIGNTSIIVPHRRLLGQFNRPMILPFLWNKTNICSIKIDMMTSTLKFPVVIYDVTRGNCTEFGRQYMDRIISCVWSGNNFSFTIREVSWLDKGIYVVLDDMGFLLDSVLLDIEENSRTSSTERPHGDISSSFISSSLSSDAENDKSKWFLISAVVVVLVLAGLIIIAVRKPGERTVPKITTNNLTDSNGSQNTVNSHHNWFQNMEKAHTPEKNIMVLTEDKSSDNLSYFAYNTDLANVKLNEKHLNARGLDAAKLSTRTMSKLQTHSIVPSSCEKLQSEPVHEHEFDHEYDEIGN